MSPFSDKVTRVIDCHVHLGDVSSLDRLLGLRKGLGMAAMNLVSITDPRTGSGHAQGLLAKLADPGAFYCFGGLNHAQALSAGESTAGLPPRQIPAPPLHQQVDLMLQAGCDGVKLIEGKPTFRQKLAFPLDGPYYADFFTRAEQLDAPVLWHVADPEEFWDPQRLPAWAAKAGWGYGPKDVPKEQLYREVENVLDRRPRLRVVFAHFYFLSADLPRAGRFLAEHPRVGLDLAPGIEMLLNFSREVNAAREFFLDHQERIFFGTDIASRHQLAQAQARADLVRRFLETDEVFTVPQAADGLLEPGGPARVRGLALPGEVLERVYHANFEAFAGQRPKPVDPPSARRECLAQADIAAAMSNVPPDQTQAGRCAQEIK